MFLFPKDILKLNYFKDYKFLFYCILQLVYTLILLLEFGLPELPLLLKKQIFALSSALAGPILRSLNASDSVTACCIRSKRTFL